MLNIGHISMGYSMETIGDIVVIILTTNRKSYAVVVGSSRALVGSIVSWPS